MLLKVLLRVCLLLVPAGVVVGMVAPYTFIEGMTREFAWIQRAVNVLGRITPGRELDDLISFALLGFVAHFVWRVSRPRQVETGILAIGVLVEIVQIWIPGREATVSHALLHLAGGIVGLVAARNWTYAWGSERLPEEAQSIR